MLPSQEGWGQFKILNATENKNVIINMISDLEMYFI